VVSFLSAHTLRAGSALVVFGLAFVAIYREMFETVLFFRGLLIESAGEGGAVALGALVGLLLLVVVVAGLQKLGRRLKPRALLLSCGILLCGLAVVMVGNGVRALQEVGIVPLTVWGGFEVRAWNRSPQKTAPLRDEGATVADSPAAAAHGADVLVTMLADADAVIDSVQQALSAGPEQQLIWIQMSTIGEDGTQRCIELARQHEVELVDAPVLGTRQPAEQGELVIMASGPAGLREGLGPIFDAIGKRTMWVGEAGSSSRLKVATNSWILAVVEGCAETLALAEGMGLEPQLLLDALEGGPLDMPYLQMKGKAIIERDFEPSFKLSLATKDAALADESARRHQLDLPLVASIRQRFEQGAREHGDADLCATYLTSQPSARA